MSVELGDMYVQTSGLVRENNGARETEREREREREMERDREKFCKNKKTLPCMERVVLFA